MRINSTRRRWAQGQNNKTRRGGGKGYIIIGRANRRGTKEKREEYERVAELQEKRNGSEKKMSVLILMSSGDLLLSLMNKTREM